MCRKGGRKGSPRIWRHHLPGRRTHPTKITSDKTALDKKMVLGLAFANASAHALSDSVSAGPWPRALRRWCQRTAAPELLKNCAVAKPSVPASRPGRLPVSRTCITCSISSRCLSCVLSTIGRSRIQTPVRSSCAPNSRKLQTWVAILADLPLP